MNHWRFKYLLAGAGGLNWYYARLTFDVSRLNIPYPITITNFGTDYVTSPYLYFQFRPLGTQTTFTACPYAFGVADMQFVPDTLDANYLSCYFLTFNNQDAGTGGTEDRSRGMLDFNRRINSQTNASNRARVDFLYNVDIYVSDVAPLYGETAFTPTNMVDKKYLTSTTMTFTNLEQKDGGISAYGDKYVPWTQAPSVNPQTDVGYGAYPIYITPNN
tara:strand:+ start:1564 stop:2214 length:651 start_codon:yes stop_codon:yes gene_type:complete